MSLSGERLAAKLRKDFEKREDMVLFDLDGEPDQPSIVGLVRKSYNVSRTTESTFQTFNRTADEDHGVGFCIEFRWDNDGILTKRAAKFKDWWTKLGCLHVMGYSEGDVYEGLGLKPGD